MYHLVTVGGRTMGVYPSAEAAKGSLSPNYQEKVKLLTQEEYDDFTLSKDPASAIKDVGTLIN